MWITLPFKAFGVRNWAGEYSDIITNITDTTLVISLVAYWYIFKLGTNYAMFLAYVNSRIPHIETLCQIE